MNQFGGLEGCGGIALQAVPGERAELGIKENEEVVPGVGLPGGQLLQDCG